MAYNDAQASHCCSSRPLRDYGQDLVMDAYFLLVPFPDLLTFCPAKMRMPLHLLSGMPRIEVRNLMACFVEFGVL